MKRVFIIKCIVFLFFLCVFNPENLAHADLTPNGPVDSAEVERFFDAYMNAKMSTHHIAGAVVSVVKDSLILFTKGYGLADIALNKKVDTHKSVFILGSLSKVFTWTAIMQLVEQGKLDLNADINSYLDFKIPATFLEPITLNNLMAHTSGFEDNKFDQMAANALQLKPHGEWLKRHIPVRVRAPGQLSAYGNYGTALAGYIIERVS